MSGFHNPCRVFIVDDHPIFREGLRGQISLAEDLTVCGEASTLPEALSNIESTVPNVVVLDIALGEHNGFELLDLVRSKLPRVSVLVLSMYDELLYAESALKRGAKGYLMKSVMPHEILQAIRSIFQGRIHVSPEVSDRVLGKLGQKHEVVSQGGIETLTERELEVFRLLGAGLSSKDIGARLHISHKTVETYRLRIKEKLGVATSAELIVRAAQWVRRH